jgi:CRP-like cAMP-binding protein
LLRLSFNCGKDFGVARRKISKNEDLREAPVRYLPVGERLAPELEARGEGDVRAVLAEIGQPMRVEKGALIYRRQQRVTSVYLVTQGAAKTFSILPNGSERIIAFRFAGDFLGLSDHGRHRDSARAIIDLALVKIPFIAVMDLAKRDVATALFLFEMMREDVREAQRHIAILGRGDALGKLSLYIEALEERQRLRGLSSNQLLLPVSRSDVADYVGLTAEALSRAFTSLGQQKILLLKGKRHLAITDRERFRALISPPAAPSEDDASGGE